MLVERGAQRVVSFDILPQPPTAWQDGFGSLGRGNGKAGLRVFQKEMYA